MDMKVLRFKLHDIFMRKLYDVDSLTTYRCEVCGSPRWIHIDKRLLKIGDTSHPFHYGCCSRKCMNKLKNG